MAVKARSITLTTTPVLIEAPQKDMVIYFEPGVGGIRIGGSDLTSTTNGFNPNSLDTPGDNLVLNRGDDLYAVATTGTPVLNYLAIGN